MVRPWCVRWRRGGCRCGESIQFRYACAPGTVEFTRVYYPRQIHWVDRIVQSQSGTTVAKCRIGPALATALGTAQIEVSSTRRHAVQIDRVRQETSTDLDLTELHVVSKRPVSNLFLGLSSHRAFDHRDTWRTNTERRR